MSPFRVASTPRLFLSRSLRDRCGGKRVAARVGTGGVRVRGSTGVSGAAQARARRACRAHLRSNSGLCSLRSRVSRDDTQQFEMEHMRSMSWFIVCCPAILFVQYSLNRTHESRLFARHKWASRACALPWR